jgi:hypothetical protein
MDSEETVKAAIQGLQGQEREAETYIKYLEEARANSAEIFLAKKQKLLFQSIRRQFEHHLEKLQKARNQSS